MNLTVALTGALPAVIIVSAILTALVSVLLLWLYRRAVIRGMGARAGVSPEPPRAAPSSSALRSGMVPVLGIIDASSPPQPSDAYARAARSLNRCAGVHALGGLAYALVLTSAWMIAAQGGFVPTRFLWLFFCYSWPIVLAVIVIGPAREKAVVVLYVALVLVAAGVGLVRNPDLTVGQLLYFWVFANAPGTALLLAFMNRRVRAVGPLVLAFMTMAVTGAFIVINSVAGSEGLMRWVVSLGGAAGLGGTTIFVLLHFVGFALFGLLGWPLLRRLGRGYQQKRMSDQTIVLDALWLLFGVVQSFTLVFEGWAWIFTGIVAFAAYKLVVGHGFKRLAGRGAEAPQRTLLLLRVFSLGQRSQRFFDLLSRLWLRGGSISLIAGPDLATSTVEPHEFLDFVGGKMSRQFVQGETDLTDRMARMDTGPDPDGRHRVNEFFCHADTWQMTMLKLAKQSDAILMDLRSFSTSNQGCLYELRQLMNSIPLDRVIFVIDDSTDRTFFETTVREIWRDLAPDSPNAALSQPCIRCFAVKHQNPEELEKLLPLLFGVRAVPASLSTT